MLENEVRVINGKEVVLYRDVETGLYRFAKDAVDMLLEAFEELQKIKELGECYIIPKNGTWEANGIDIHKAIEKQIPKKPLNDYCWHCPNCEEEVYWDTECGRQKFKYCHNCGQKIDWH